MSDLVHSPLLLAIELPILTCILKLTTVYYFNCELTNSVLFKEVTNFVSRIQEVVVADMRVIVGSKTRLQLMNPFVSGGDSVDNRLRTMGCVVTSNSSNSSFERFSRDWTSSLGRNPGTQR
jgi:hypothetical protein